MGGAAVQTLNNGVIINMTREEDERNDVEIAFRRANMSEKFVAAHTRHPDIGNDQIRPVGLHYLQPQVAIFSFNYIMVLAFKHTPDRISKISFVV